MAKKKPPGSLRETGPRRPVEPTGDALLTTTRIDPPHVVAGAASASQEDETPVALSTLASAAAAPRAAAVWAPATQPPAWQFSALPADGLALEQVHSQAAQIAAQLSKQQTALDHREAEINARAAAVESQVRTARLWLTEKLEMLAQHKGDLTWAGEEAPASGADPFDSARKPGDAAMPLSEAAQLWRQERWQEQFENWRREREAGLEGSSETPPGQPSDDPASQPLAVPVYRRKEAEARIEMAEQRLAARASELEAKRAELAADRKTFEAEREAFGVHRQEERWRLAEQRRTMSEKLMRQRARLRRRRDDFDARETALRQLRADLLRAQQQTLEMRLAAEELWARLRGKGSAADAGPARPHPRHSGDDERHEGAA
jgi:hypothetical protein